LPVSANEALAVASSMSDEGLARLEEAVAQEGTALRGEKRLITALAQRHAALETRTNSLSTRLKLELDRRHIHQRKLRQGGMLISGSEQKQTLGSVVGRSAIGHGVGLGISGWGQELKSHLMAQSLAALTGLKATIPLLVMLIGSKCFEDFPLTISPEFSWLVSWPAIAFIVLLALLEVLGDAVPVIDEFMDMVMIGIKPAIANVIVFAQLTTDDTNTRLIFAALATLNCVGVAMAKQAATMMLDVATGGSGAPIRSIFENIASAGLAIVTFVVPIAAPLIIATSVAISFAFCFSTRTRAGPKSAPYLASLCLWPEGREYAQVVQPGEKPPP